MSCEGPTLDRLIATLAVRVGSGGPKEDGSALFQPEEPQRLLLRVR
jgi:hypothetical protein